MKPDSNAGSADKKIEGERRQSLPRLLIAMLIVYIVWLCWLAFVAWVNVSAGNQ